MGFEPALEIYILAKQNKSMKRLTQKERKLIKELSKRSWSINKICSKLNLKKSVVYYWFIKYVNKKSNKVKIKYELEEEIGEVIGAFAGDGNYYFDPRNYEHKIRFYLSPDEEKYAEVLSSKIGKLFNKLPRIYKYSYIIIVEIISKDVSNFIKNYLFWKENKTKTVQLIKPISKYSIDFLRGFCRGLFDTDGWITKNNLMISCVSDNLMKDLSYSLKSFSIQHKLTEWKRRDEPNPVKAIVLDKQNTTKYFHLIGTSNSKRKMMPPQGVSG